MKQHIKKLFDQAQNRIDSDYVLRDFNYFFLNDGHYVPVNSYDIIEECEAEEQGYYMWLIESDYETLIHWLYAQKQLIKKEH